MSNNSFWLGWLPFNQLKQGRESFSVPAFSFTFLTWLGASYIITRFTFSGTREFSLEKINAPTDVNYCAVVNTGSARYKLWEGVNEKVDLPLYNSEVLPAGTILEIWTTTSTTASSSGLTLLTSRLSARPDTTSTDSAATTTEDSTIWAAMPLVLPSTFNSARS